MGLVTCGRHRELMIFAVCEDKVQVSGSVPGDIVCSEDTLGFWAWRPSSSSMYFPKKIKKEIQIGCRHPGLSFFS